MQGPATKSEPALAMPSTPVMVRSRVPTWLIAILLVLVTVALYWPAMRCGFVNFDDPDFVSSNPHIQGGLSWEGTKWAFRNTEQAVYWAPLMWLSHMAAWQLFGANAWGHHLINVLLHAANTVLVFLVLRRMTGATWRSLMVAALFGWHPLRVESVVWVTERKDVLSALFWMLTLWMYVKYAEAANVRHSKANLWYGMALGMFVLGLMSKAILVTLPCVLLLLDYWPLRRFRLSTLNSASRKFSEQLSTIWQLGLEKIPFFALAMVAGVETLIVQQHGGAVMPVEDLPFGARIGNALISYCRYVGRLFWPADLAVFYPHPGYWPVAKVLVAGGLLLVILALLIAKRRRYPFLLMGWLWYCGTLVPVIGLVQSSDQAMADRFTYVSFPGLLILAIWGAHELTGRWRYRAIALSVAGTAATVLCMTLTRQQISYWKDGEALFQHALEATENNYVAHLNLGNALDLKGRTNAALGQYQEALRLKPDYTDAHDNLGIVLLKKGQTDEAISQFREALRLKPDDAKAHSNLGAALGRKGQTDDAIIQYQEAIRLKPDDAAPHYNLGTAFVRKGQLDEAIRQFQEAVRLKPNGADAHYNLGVVLGMKGQLDGAISQLQEAIRLKPDDPDARDILRNVLLRKGQPNEVVR